VLYRSNPQSRLFEEALRMRGIPYKIVGSMSFLDRKEIKDVLSYWRLVVNQKDDPSARRVVNWPSRGIGRASIEVLAAAAVKNGFSFVEAMRSVDVIMPKAAAGVKSFLALLARLRSELEATPVDGPGLAAWAKRSLELIGVKQALFDDEDDPAKAERQWENVDELAHALGQMNLIELAQKTGALTSVDVLVEYLNQLTLEALDSKDEDDDDDGKSKDQVTLLTLHGSKGLEFPVVFVVGMEEGLIPHRRVIEEASDFSEERRLCYVGITRAKERLFLTRAKHRIRYGKKVPRTPSRFLGDIPGDLIATNDTSEVPDFTSKAARDAHENNVKNYLAELRAVIKR
jgi:DNA helicase-2/ATP-dependent DNA helicase PcrA